MVRGKMIADIIKLVRTNPFYGAGEFTEIAKGKNEIDNYFRKIKRLWLSKSRLT
jgi:hypothetical protein